ELLLASHEDVVIVSIGGEKFPGDLERLRNEAAARGIDSKIRFLGSRADALDFVAAADVFVNPADVEGLPVAILEAMALGKPVVATAVGGVPSVVLDGQTGRLVPPKNPEGLASAMAELLASSEERRRLAGNARALIERRFSLARMVERYENVYDEVLGAVRR
nr:glycosyltransferase [Acidimicrobiia bacterium]